MVDKLLTLPNPHKSETVSLNVLHVELRMETQASCLLSAIQSKVPAWWAGLWDGEFWFECNVARHQQERKCLCINPSA